MSRTWAYTRRVETLNGLLRSLVAGAFDITCLNEAHIPGIGVMSTNTRTSTSLLEAAPDAIIAVRADGRIALANAQVERLFGYHRDELIGRPIEILVPDSVRAVHAGNRDAYVPAPITIVAVRADGHIALVSAQVARLFGYDCDELIGDPVEVLVPEAFRKVHADQGHAYISQPLTRPMGAGMEFIGRRKDSSEFPAEISLSAIHTEDGVLAVVAIRDGTDRKEAAIIASSADDIISTTVDGVIASWNPAAERLYGHRSVDVLGKHIDVLMPKDDVDAERELLARAARGERVPEYETVRVCADDSLVAVATTVSPILDDAGNVVGVSTISRDITERKEEQAAREALEDRLHQSQRLESLGQLAGGIAHDFNNLLAVILNYAAFVAEEVADNEAVCNDVVQIRAAAERAARLTEQLLIFARRETVQLQVLDLNAVVTDIKNLLARTLGEDVALTVHLADELPTIRADRGQMEQVVLNLAVNARDAMPNGGTLTINTGTTTIDAADHRLRPELPIGHYVELMVRDTGLGMSKEVVAHAFEPFFTTKPSREGSGLGLATTYGIIAESDGAITLSSEEGIGTTVCIRLPVVDEVVDVTRIVAQSPGGNGETILVVEDEEAMRRVTARILNRNGYHVLEATSCEDALDLVAAHNCDLLLTDVVMPVMSGPDLAEQVHVRHPDVPVLFMSGYSKGVLGGRRVLGDGIALVRKPFDEPTLLEKVQSVLAGVQ